MALKILIPEATENLCTNPSFEVDTTSWSGTSSVSANRSLLRSRFGRASYRCECAGADLSEGVAYVPNGTGLTVGVANTPVTVSIYARGKGAVRLRLRPASNTAIPVWGPIVQLTDEYWQRLVLTTQIGHNVENDLRIGVRLARLDPHGPGVYDAADFYLDGCQIELKGHATTYADGDQELELAPHAGNPYFEWEGQRHASQSARTKAYRLGGQYQDLVQGLDVDVYPTEGSGLGMPPLALGTQIYSGDERANVQSVKALPRSLGLTFHARRLPDSNECAPKSLKVLNRARKAIEDAMKPDLVHKPQSFLLRYEDGPCPMDLEAMYESGMEWEGDLRDPYVNSFGVRMFGPNPYWQADSQDTTELETSKVPITDHAYLIARLEGEWDGFGSANFPVRVLALHPNGDIYAGGDFTHIGGLHCGHIARWNGTTWTALAPGTLGAELVLNPGFETAGTAVELLLNPGFETAGGGGADIWANWLEIAGDGALADETTLVHSGGHAAKLTCGPTPDNVYLVEYPIVIAGTTYQYTFWTRGDGTNAGRYGIRDDTAGAWVQAVGTTGVAGTTYAQVSVVATAPAGCANMDIYLISPPVNGGIAYFDDVSVKSADLFGTWVETVGAGAIADELTLVHSGAHAAKLTCGTGALTNVAETITVVPGTTHALTFETRGDGTNAGRYRVYDLTHAADIIPLVTTGITAAAYSQVSTTFAVPTGCVSVRLDLFCPTTVAGIVYFDDVSVKQYMPGVANGSVYAIDFASNGDVYIGGTFTAVGTVTYNRVARYTPSTDTFDVLGAGTPGLNSDVNAIAIDKTGQVYIGGAFTQVVQGAVSAYRIVRYNGAVTDTWTTMGAHAGLNLDVEALEIDLDGTALYLGGQFTNEETHLGISLLPYICKWTTLFEAIAEDGLNGVCRALRMGLDGKLYLAGDFTIAGWWAVAKVAYWNRVEFYPLGGDGDGLTGGARVNTIDIDNRGNVYFGGDFTGATNDSLAAYVALWNGTRFGHVDAVFPGEVLAIASKYDKLFVGYLGAALTDIADVQTVMNNGAASVYPMLDVLGPLVLRSLENQETGKLIRFNLDVQAGERVLVDLRPGFLRAVSEWRGNVIYGVLPYSDFGDFALLPGNNQVAFLGTGGDGNEEVSLHWRVTDWSFDDIR